jgi:glycosyltransferase involved in cell wall biosynthesis
LNGTLAKEELIKAAIKILKDPEPWWKNSLKVAEKYSWERTAELWKSLLNKL